MTFRVNTSGSYYKHESGDRSVVLKKYLNFHYFYGLLLLVTLSLMRCAFQRKVFGQLNIIIRNLENGKRQ